MVWGAGDGQAGGGKEVRQGRRGILTGAAGHSHGGVRVVVPLPGERTTMGTLLGCV